MVTWHATKCIATQGHPNIVGTALCSSQSFSLLKKGGLASVIVSDQPTLRLWGPRSAAKFHLGFSLCTLAPRTPANGARKWTPFGGQIRVSLQVGSKKSIAAGFATRHSADKSRGSIVHLHIREIGGCLWHTTAGLSLATDGQHRAVCALRQGIHTIWAPNKSSQL